MATRQRSRPRSKGGTSAGRLGLVGCIREALAASAPTAVFTQRRRGAEALVTELIARRAGVSMPKVASGTFAKEEWPKLTRAAAWLSEQDLYIDDTPGVKMKAAIQRILRLERELNSRGKHVQVVLFGGSASPGSKKAAKQWSNSAKEDNLSAWSAQCGRTAKEILALRLDPRP